MSDVLAGYKELEDGWVELTSEVGELDLRLDQTESELSDVRNTVLAVERVVAGLVLDVERLRVAVGGTALRGAL
ncbi:MAG: hypothetical protein ACRDH2_17900 [Anaerolineales bacterium]